MAYIQLWDKRNQFQKIPLKDHMMLGRSGSDTPGKIIPDSLIISKEHGQFTKDGNQFFYCDTGSTNGTYLNDSRCVPGRGISLEDGDVIRIDCPDGHIPHKEAVLMIYREKDGPDTAWENIPLEEKAEISPLWDCPIRFFKSRGRWVLEKTSDQGRVVINRKEVKQSVYVYPLDVICIYKRTDEEECQITILMTEKRMVVQHRQKHGHEQELEPKLQTQSQTEPKFQQEPQRVFLPKAQIKPQQDQLSPFRKDLYGSGLQIHIRERSVRHNFKKMILLQDIRLQVGSGEMVLILGGSGAGKTTFMNAVMGYEKADGQILYGNTDIYEEYDRMKYKIGFVPQKDLLRQSDTVFDTLLNAAQMKLPKHVSAEQIKDRIETVLFMLGLNREQNSLVGKLSGGQRKRLSIAVEFIADPSLFFLDEPDSGLDGIMARTLMENLRGIADEGKIVMVITHGPDRAADLFDQVVVLAKSTIDNCGHLAYYGPVKEAYRYFGADTLEGVVKKINRKDEGGEGLSDYYIEKFRKQEVEHS